MANRIKMGPKKGMVGDMEVNEFQMKPNVPNSANDMLRDPMQTRMQLGMMPSVGMPMKEFKEY
tara:strand:+ start:280 stop:468 length:189 start_codon:yes stop_codon:yes gene_type:complete